MSLQGQTNLLDYIEAVRLRDAGMARAAANCPSASEAAYVALKRLAERQPNVHIDDFIPVLDTLEVKPSPNAMGAIWRRAVKDNLLEKTGRSAPCTKHQRKHAHDYPIYRSLVHRSVE